jgi:hypothetical protein
MHDERANHRPNSVSAHPRHGESFAGYVLRLARLRRLGNWTEIGRLCGMGALTNNPSEAALEALSADARVPIEELRAVCQGNRNQPNASYMGVPLPRHAFSFRGGVRRRVCPQCLEEDPFHRAIWDIAYVNLCPFHLKLLIDTCRDCGTRLRWVGADPALCVCRRGGNLSQMEAPDVSSVDASGIAVVHGLLGDGRFAARAADARGLAPFRDLPDPAILEFALRLGMQVTTGRCSFSAEVTYLDEPYVHHAFREGFRVAEGWPEKFFDVLDEMARERWRKGGRLRSTVGLVEDWLKKVPDDHGHAIAAALADYRRLASPRKGHRFTGRA